MKFKARSSAIAAAAILLSVHVGVLVLRYGTDTASLWGDWIGAVAAPLLAAVGAWVAARDSGTFGKRVWRLVALSLLLASVGGVLYTYFFDYRQAPNGLWPSDIFVFFWPVPAMMSLFLTPRDPNRSFRWLRFCDFVQICTLVLSVELSQLYMPSRWQSSALAMQVRELYAGIVFFGLIAFSFLIRALLTTFPTARLLFLRLSIFFFAFAITTNTTLYGFATGHFEGGNGSICCGPLRTA